jgi:hypothetical protein
LLKREGRKEERRIGKERLGYERGEGVRVYEGIEVWELELGVLD